MSVDLFLEGLSGTVWVELKWFRVGQFRPLCAAYAKLLGWRALVGKPLSTLCLPKALSGQRVPKPVAVGALLVCPTYWALRVDAEENDLRKSVAPGAFQRFGVSVGRVMAAQLSRVRSRAWDKSAKGRACRAAYENSSRGAEKRLDRALTRNYFDPDKTHWTRSAAKRRVQGCVHDREAFQTACC